MARNQPMSNLHQALYAVAHYQIHNSNDNQKLQIKYYVYSAINKLGAINRHLMNSSIFFKNAPKYISQRFSTVNSYTWNSFFPENSLNERLKKFPYGEGSKAELARIKDIVNEASIVIFIFLIKRFFLDGSDAAKQAVDTFKDLGLASFQIGTKKFADRNKNVMKGEELANQLMNSIASEELKTLINESQYVTQIIDKYKPLIEG